MLQLLQRFFLHLAGSTDRDLARMLEYLKVENRILRSKLPRRFSLTHRERRRLIRYGRPLGRVIQELVTIVTPRTFARWLARPTDGCLAPSTRKPGRPRTAAAIRELVLRLARETGWGYTRILGELKKLGIRSICRSTVINILKEQGFDPGPRRGEGTWIDYLKRHAQTLWACDFLTKGVPMEFGSDRMLR